MTYLALVLSALFIATFWLSLAMLFPLKWVLVIGLCGAAAWCITGLVSGLESDSHPQDGFGGFR